MVLVALNAIVVGSLFAFSLGAFARTSLFEAHQHGNTALLFLHVFWIILIVSFISNVPLWLYGGLPLH